MNIDLVVATGQCIERTKRPETYQTGKIERENRLEVHSPHGSLAGNGMLKRRRIAMVTMSGNGSANDKMD